MYTRKWVAQFLVIFSHNYYVVSYMQISEMLNTNLKFEHKYSRKRLKKLNKIHNVYKPLVTALSEKMYLDFWEKLQRFKFYLKLLI